MKKKSLITTTPEETSDVDLRPVELALCKRNEEKGTKPLTTFLTTQQTARALDISPATSKRWIKPALLKAHPTEDRILLLECEVLDLLTKLKKGR